MKGLHPCSSCQRHVKIGASQCPFCGASFSAPAPLRPIRPARRIARLALTAALANTACGDGAAGLDAAPLELDASSSPDVVLSDVYGVPADGGLRDAMPGDGPDVGQQDAAPGDVYGVPADAGFADASPGDVYGVPSDAGVPDAQPGD